MSWMIDVKLLTDPHDIQVTSAKKHKALGVYNNIIWLLSCDTAIKPAYTVNISHERTV